MADNMAAAPVLSTPDNHILTEIEPTTNTERTTSLSEEHFKIRYEIDRTVKAIRDQGWKRVALQFPDHMLSHSARVSQLLSRGLSECVPEPAKFIDADHPELSLDSLRIDTQAQPVKLTILADTSYGSCCVDEIAAEHVEADAVIHYGRACLSPTARLPVLHIFTQSRFDEAAAVEAFVDAFPHSDSNVILTADIPYASHVQSMADRLSVIGYAAVFAAKIVHDPSSLIPNRTLPQMILENPEQLSAWHIYHIAEPPTALLLNLTSKVQSIRIFRPDLDGAIGNAQAQEANTSMVLRRRYALVTSMSTVSTWGILINTLSVKNYMHVVDHVKKQIAAAGKKSYLFVVGKLNAAKIANFAEIGGWVVIGCWESSLIDSRDFFKPILTPFELELALKTDETRVWTGAWRSDFEGVLEDVRAGVAPRSVPEDGEGQEAEREELEMDSDEESAPPEFDLRTGRYVSQSRPMGRPGPSDHGIEVHGSKSSTALTKRMNGDLVAVNGVASPAAEFLAQQRTWKGLGSDFEIKYEDEEEDEQGGLVEQGRSGVARGYVVGDSNKT